jgi:hypothetical protein
MTDKPCPSPFLFSLAFLYLSMLSPSLVFIMFVCLLLSHATHMSTRDSCTQAYCTLSYALFCPFSWFRRFTDSAVVVLGVGERVGCVGIGGGVRLWAPFRSRPSSPVMIQLLWFSFLYAHICRIFARVHSLCIQLLLSFFTGLYCSSSIHYSLVCLLVVL